MSIPRRICRLACRLLIGLGAAAIVVDAGSAEAGEAGAGDEFETKYIFGGFTFGSSIGTAGEVSFEPETEAHFGRGGSRYAASETELELDLTPNRYVEIELGPTISYYGIRDVPGLDNRDMATINGFESDFRFLLLERDRSPFAVALSIEPELHSLDQASGAKAWNYALETRLEADTELLKDRLYLALDLLYEPQTTAAGSGGWFDESTLGLSSALAYRIVPNVAVGIDLWYLRQYQGAAFGSFTGDATYLGPTFFWQVTPKIHMSAAWETLVASRAAGVAGPDLIDFSRQRARLLLEFEF